MSDRGFGGRWFVPFVVVGALVVGAGAVRAQEAGAGNAGQAPSEVDESSLGDVVATYSLGEIREGEMERAGGVRLYQVRQQEYELEERAIRQLVSERLLRAAALREGKTRDQLYAERVENLVKEPPSGEVDAVMKTYRSQLPEDDAEARALVVQALKDRQRKRLEQALQKQLLASADLKIMLEPPRAPITIDPSDPVRGPADAPITIVEFSDFQCSFCARSQQTLHLLRLKYPGLIRIVFKNMPGSSHDRARPAAEAALCAARQGKFWELHDWLFSNQQKLDDESIAGAAKNIGLDMEAFEKCLESDETLGQIDASLNMARILGLSGTPVFFINGIMVRGARPLPVFDEIVRSELDRLGIPIPGPEEKAAGKPGPVKDLPGPGKR